MNYTLHQLQIFLKVAQMGHVSKAAEDLNLTQPAVSIQLKKLQEQFPIPLTEMIGRRLYITDFGREIAAAAENILNEVYAINYRTLAHKGQLTGRLKISSVSTGKYVMPYFLSAFIQQHPGVELLMDVTNKSKVVESLQNNEVDFSLVSIVPAGMAVNSVSLLDNKLYLVGSKNNRVDASIGIKELFAKLPLIFREAGSGTRQAMEDYLHKNKIVVRKKMELTSNEAIKQAVLAGLGYSIMPLIGIKNEIRSGQMKIVPVRGLPIRTAWRLIWLKQKQLSPVANAYLEFIHREKDLIKEQWFSKMEPKN